MAKQYTAEELLPKIIDGSPIPSFVINKAHAVTHWNTALESLSGIRKHDIIGTDAQWLAFYTEKRPTLADLIVDGATESKLELYYRGKCKKSTLIRGAYEAEDFFPALGERGKWLHFTASPVKNKSGRIIGALETLQDITGRKNSEELLSGIINGSPIPSFVIDKRHRVTHWNTAIESLSGIKNKDILGTDGQWRSFYAEKRPSMADLIIDGASADEIEAYYSGSCKKSILIEDAYEAEGYFPALSTGGKWLHFTASPIKNRFGEAIGAIETLEDITTRKIAQEALYQSERSFRDLFESALDAMWINDIDGKIKMANAACARLSGHPLAQLNRSDTALFLTPVSLVFAREIQSKLVSRQPVDMPYKLRLMKKGGAEIIIEVTTRLIERDTQPATFQNTVRDVTTEITLRENIHFYLQKVLAAQEEERMRIARDLHDDTAQSLLLLIHKLDAEISNPKNRISAPVKKKLNGLNVLATETLKGIRRYAQELRPAILDDMGLVAALEWMGDKLTSENGIEVTVQADKPYRELSRDTQLVLFRIAQEAITNVKRHAEASKVIIRLESGPEMLRMVISDNGKGFNVLSTLSDLSSRGKLGLIGMQERAQLLNGGMSVQSEQNKGTTITFEIPQAG